MKNLTLVLLFFWLLGCGAKQMVSELPGKRILKGTWEVTDIDFIGEKGIYKAFLFDAADSACFKGSEWVFIPNNASGRFTTNVSNSTCNVENYRIIWSFLEVGSNKSFQFKYADEKNKPQSKDKTGYRADINELTADNMTITVPSTYDGNTFNVVMKFLKKSDNINL
jgi:predicted ATP-binding protein involved in virulence